MTQNQAVLNWLKEKPITSRDAVYHLGIHRLSARIFDLKEMGHEIEQEMKKVVTRYGTTYVAEYKMKGKK